MYNLNNFDTWSVVVFWVTDASGLRLGGSIIGIIWGDVRLPCKPPAFTIYTEICPVDNFSSLIASKVSSVKRVFITLNAY